MRTIIARAESMELNAIAEGETGEQKQLFFSRYLGMYENFQDFLDGKPKPIKQFERALIMPQLLRLYLKIRNGFSFK